MAFASLVPKPTDDTTKGGLTYFKELFTVIPCGPKDFNPIQAGGGGHIVPPTGFSLLC